MGKPEDKALEDIFADAGVETAGEETKPTANETSSTPSSNDENKTEDNAVLDKELGKVDESFFEIKKDDVSEIKRFEFKKTRTPDSTSENPKYETDKDVLLAFMDVKESFTDEFTEKHIKIKNNEHDNNVIKHVFGPYNVYDFDTLAKLTNPEVFKRAKQQFNDSGREFKFDVYRSSFKTDVVDQNGNKTTDTKVFYKFTNRPGNFSKFPVYSSYYQQNGGFPAMPDGYLNQLANPETGTIRGRILSFNINSRFKRFEIEFDPVDANDNSLFEDENGRTEDFRTNAQAKDIHSYLATYPFSMKTPLEESNKRAKQAAAISESLNILDFKQWDEAIGEVKIFNLNAYDNKFKGSGKVFRAKLK